MAYQITASASGTLNTAGINVNASGSGNIRLAIYSDNSNAPGTLLGQSASTAAVGTSWNDLAITGVSIVSGNKYWLSFQASAGATTFFYTGTGITQFNVAQAYGTFPTGVSYSSGTGQGYNMRMSYTQSSTGNNWF